MGQKTHPYAFRLGVVNDWKSKWYSDGDYVALVNEDWKLRDYLRGQLRRGAVSRIDIERATDDERNAFLDLLSELEVPMVRRYSVGRGKHAACGILAAHRAQDEVREGDGA